MNRGQRVLCGLRGTSSQNTSFGNRRQQSGEPEYDWVRLLASRPTQGRQTGGSHPGSLLGTRGVFPASNNAVPFNPVPFNTVQAIENAERTAALGRIVPNPKGLLGASENGDLSSLRQELEDALAPEIKRNEVAISVGPDGLIVSLREIGFFDSGSAKIRATSLSAFSRIAWLLAERNCRMRIEGHTDNKPIHNTQFSDNWELSMARATELVRMLITK
jgi:flagellar motor protein MotB